MRFQTFDRSKAKNTSNHLKTLCSDIKLNFSTILYLYNRNQVCLRHCNISDKTVRGMKSDRMVGNKDQGGKGEKRKKKIAIVYTELES